MTSTTANYALLLPSINGDDGTWGASLNTDLGIIDTKMFANGPSMSVNAIGAATLATFSTAGANFTVNKAAGTNLANINGASNGLLRWQMNLGDNTAETGSNANVGSNFEIRSFQDDGTPIGTTLSIQRLSGAMFINGNGATYNTASFSTAAANLSLNKAGSGSLANLNGMNNGQFRWQMNLGNAAAESGGNVGSDFSINNFTDFGVLVAAPLVIQRSSGAITNNANGATPSTLVFNSGWSNLSLNKAGASAQASLNGMNNGVMRWQIIMGNTSAESGGDVGSGFAIQSFHDNGANFALPLQISRATGVCQFSQAIINGPSDRSLKENIRPLAGSLEKVLALQGMSFNLIGQKERQIGLVAQDVEPVVPEIIQPYVQEGKPAKALDYPKLTALLIEAVKELTAKVAALEERLA